nr:hypothetical protein BaRGS_006250 [Batillaria attramentaria]
MQRHVWTGEITHYEVIRVAEGYKINVQNPSPCTSSTSCPVKSQVFSCNLVKQERTRVLFLHCSHLIYVVPELSEGARGNQTVDAMQKFDDILKDADGPPSGPMTGYYTYHIIDLGKAGYIS